MDFRAVAACAFLLVLAVGAGCRAHREQMARSYVNPALRLPDSMVRFGRSPFSYRPGEPLGDFKLYFDHAPGAGRDDKFEIVGVAYRLRRSACFQRSGGKLLCTTCHNPHQSQHGEAAVERMTVACRSCHEPILDRLAAGGRHSASSDCASCHMPKRRSQDVVHAVVTDHFIRRQPARDDLLAPVAEMQETPGNAYRGEVVPYYPAPFPQTPENELHAAVAQVVQKSNLVEGVRRLSAAVEKHRPANAEFYLILADAYREEGQMEKALPQYEEALRRDPSLVAARLQLGSALRAGRQPDRAAEGLREALRQTPDRANGW